MEFILRYIDVILLCASVVICGTATWFLLRKEPERWRLHMRRKGTSERWELIQIHGSEEQCRNLANLLDSEGTCDVLIRKEE